MEKSRTRLDSYGRPLPTLAPAERQVLLHSEQNRAMRAYIVWLLEHTYAELFQRGIWAEVTIHVTIKDGTMQNHMDVELKRQHRHEREED